jgi:hypothetical protein
MDMKIQTRIAFLLLAMVAANLLVAGPALAHRFNVALVLPPLTATTAVPDQARQIRAGFMLATTERDSHPDQESDGHLGGLDVYVAVIDGAGDAAAEIGRIARSGAADIVVAFGSDALQSRIAKLLEGAKTVLLRPGPTPFGNAARPAVAAFKASYRKQYGGAATPNAARGYNAARRIDLAVREQGGTDDQARLRRNFRATARGSAW